MLQFMGKNIPEVLGDATKLFSHLEDVKAAWKANADCSRLRDIFGGRLGCDGFGCVSCICARFCEPCVFDRYLSMREKEMNNEISLEGIPTEDKVLTALIGKLDNVVLYDSNKHLFYFKHRAVWFAATTGTDMLFIRQLGEYLTRSFDKVYRLTDSLVYANLVDILNDIKNGNEDSGTKFKLLWSKVDQVKEMTLTEVIKQLGYPVKIVEG